MSTHPAQKYLLLLGAEQFLRERAVVAGLRCCPWRVIAVSQKAVSGRNRLFDAMLPGDPMDPESVLAAVEKHEREAGAVPAAVVPVNDWTIAPGLAVAERYGLPYLSRSAAFKARNKAAMKQAFVEHGLTIAPYRRFTDVAGLRAAARELGFPLVIKPIDFGGSGGVLRVDSAADIEPAYRASKGVLDRYAHIFHVEDHAFLAEGYVPAVAEVSIEVMNQGERRAVLAVTDKYLGPEPYFAEVGHVVPSVVSSDARLRAVAIGACAALGIDIGVAHVEVRIGGDGGLTLMEVGPRSAGDGILDQVERVYGYNPYELHVRAYLGETVEVPAAAPCGTSAIAFLKAQEGVITAVREPRALPPELVSLYITGKPGDRVESPQRWDTREGIAEFFWPGRHASARVQDHLVAARELADAIFTVDAQSGGSAIRRAS